MKGLETKNIFDAEPPIEKAKGAIIGSIAGKAAVFSPIRSEIEDTRTGQHDWVGGTLEPGEAPIDALKRDGGEELRDADFDHIIELGTHKKTKQGQKVFTHLFALIALFPPDGVQLSEEHSGWGWILLEQYRAEADLPDKYKDSLLSEEGLLVVQSLELIASHEPLATPEPSRLIIPKIVVAEHDPDVPELLAA